MKVYYLHINFFLGSSDHVTIIAELVVGKEASSFNTVVDDIVCFNFNRSEDEIKEGLEVVVLSLNSLDPGVRPCRD